MPKALKVIYFRPWKQQFFFIKFVLEEVNGKEDGEEQSIKDEIWKENEADSENETSRQDQKYEVEVTRNDLKSELEFSRNEPRSELQTSRNEPKSEIIENNSNSTSDSEDTEGPEEGFDNDEDAVSKVRK